MELDAFTDRLDEELRIDEYAAVDDSANGLQVDREAGSVEHVAVAVTAAAETIDEAVAAGADVLVTHHGLFWGGLERLTGRNYERIAPLVEHDVALYTAHLPLDGHQTLGNAAGVADEIGLVERAPFGTVGDQHIGQQGRLPESVPAPEIVDRLGDLERGGQPVQHLDFGPDHVESVAILTGSGVDWLGEAEDAGVDALVTGEGKAYIYHEAREAGMHVYLAGHYATETFGVHSIADLCTDWGLETTSISAPTGL